MLFLEAIARPKTHDFCCLGLLAGKSTGQEALQSTDGSRPVSLLSPFTVDVKGPRRV
jgi:hypothetical protein